MMFNKFKNGFTLAEVLITLVIIGVVAALTISAVINTYVERSTISKVKKGLSTISQAIKLAEAQNGPIVGWEFGEGGTAQSASDFWEYIKPHLSVVKDCGSDTNCYQNDQMYQLNRSINENLNNQSRYYKFVLADGSIMMFRTLSGRCTSEYVGSNNVCAIVVSDINGDKAPNTIGRDIFMYVIQPDAVIPCASNDCRKTATGWGCASYIIKNDNMNYLH